MKPKSKVITAGGAVGNMKFPSVPADCLLEVWEGKNGIAITRFAPNGEAQLQQGYLSCTNAPAAVCTGGYVDTSGTYFTQFNGVCLPDPLFLVQVYNGVVNVTDPSGAVHQMLAGQAISCDPSDCQAGIFCASFTHRQVVEFQAEALALGAKEPPLKPTCPSGTTSSTTTTSSSGTTMSSSTSTSTTYPGWLSARTQPAGRPFLHADLVAVRRPACEKRCGTTLLATRSSFRPQMASRSLRTAL